MKKIYIITVLLALAVTSCKRDFIDLVPQSSYTDQNFFQTDAQFKQAVTAAYAPLRNVAVTDFLVTEMRSDNSFYQSIFSNRGTAYVFRENLSDYKVDATNSYVYDEWTFNYQVISRANIVITRLKAASGIATASVNSYDGQAKFLRALCYFKLVRLFGGVPLFVNELTDPNNSFLPRSTADQIYAQIIADCNDAITELPAPTFTANVQNGAATKGSATILLADVLMQQKKYADAETALGTLAAMGYQLNTDYATVFAPATKNGRESLFEIQFLDGTTTGTTPNPMTFYFIPRATSTALILGVANNNNATGGLNTPSPNLIASYETGDKRLDASIGIAEGAYNASDQFTYSALKSVVNYTTPPAGKVAIPYCKKFVHSPVSTTSGSAEDVMIYRYSEALLLLAEAQNEQGKSPLTALNTVRTRAGLANVTSTDQVTLRAAILKERRVELAFENKRFHDLVRSGNAVSVLNTYGTALKAQFSYLPADSHIVTDGKLLLPIPAAEAGLNTSLTQNPGY